MANSNETNLNQSTTKAKTEHAINNAKANQGMPSDEFDVIIAAMDAEFNSGESADVRGSVQNLVKQKTEASQFEIKEEYILSLIENSQVCRDESQSFHDNKIHLKGNLLIDNRVKSGLNWSDVISDSATVVDGQINDYRYLPQTRFGVKTNLTTADLDLFMKKNACASKKSMDGYVVDGIFRIPDCKELPDFSPVSAKKVLCYHTGKIELNRLPAGREGFFGLKAENIIINGNNCSKIAKTKGFSKETYKALKAQEPNVLQKWFGMAFNNSNANAGNK